MKLYKQNVSLLFNQACLNERLPPTHTHNKYIYIHTHTHTCMHACGHAHILYAIYIYIYIYVWLNRKDFIFAYSIFDLFKSLHESFDFWMEWI